MSETTETKVDDGGQAFPSAFKAQYGIKSLDGVRSEFITKEMLASGGMSLRDYFAAKAMQAYLSTYPEGRCDYIEEVAADSYIMADALLKARAEQ